MRHSLIPENIIEVCRPIQFRGKARLLNQIGPNSGTRRARIFGSIFELDLEDFIQRQIYLGTAEARETRLVQRYLRPGMTFVDIGANVGYYTAMAARQVAAKGGRVIAFEPSPYAYSKLQSLITTNQLQHVTAINAGLGDQPGRLNLYLGIGSKNHTPTLIAHENTTVTEVRVLTLDAEAERLGITRIDLMKIDVEGYEPLVLRGAHKLLAQRAIGAILCEFNESWLRRGGSSREDLESVILNAGFIESKSETAGCSLENRFFRLA